VLLRYEAFISHLVGKDSRQKDLDVALVLVFSFLVLIEVTVIIFGYIFKVILMYCIHSYIALPLFTILTTFNKQRCDMVALTHPIWSSMATPVYRRVHPAR